MMALTAAGRRLLRLGAQAEMFEELVRRDPTADQGLAPWDGQSPRELTEAARGITSFMEGASPTEEDAKLDEMCRRHHHGW